MKILVTFEKCFYNINKTTDQVLCLWFIISYETKIVAVIVTNFESYLQYNKSQSEMLVYFDAFWWAIESEWVC